MKLLSGAFLPLVWACSYVEIPYVSKNNTADEEKRFLIARTMELSDLFGKTSYNIQVVPAHANGGSFAYLAPMSIFKVPGHTMPLALDGMNEAGLSVSGHTLNEAVYQTPQEGEEEHQKRVFYYDLPGFLLANAGSVQAALDLLSTIWVVQHPVLKSGMHWAIADASGRSVVVEYLEGQRVVSENHPRVMTNDPNLQWQWRNLNTHTNLNPNFPVQNDFLQVETDVGVVPRTIGHGFNLHGLPGDFSPPSRFVRMFYLRGYALRANPAKSFDDAAVLGTALLNNVFLPYGTIAADPHSPGDQLEYTPYAVLKSPAEKKMLIRGYRNSQWRMLDLKRLDMTKAQQWPLEDGTIGMQDITASGSPVTDQAATRFGATTTLEAVV